MIPLLLQVIGEHVFGMCTTNNIGAYDSHKNKKENVKLPMSNIITQHYAIDVKYNSLILIFCIDGCKF